MTNLTEQCKQRKLPDGLYWVKHDGVINILDNYEAHLTEVDEVLAEVPSYEGFMALVRAYDGVVDENTKLKELLKEVLRHDLSLKEVAELTRKISEVLGEK